MSVKALARASFSCLLGFAGASEATVMQRTQAYPLELDVREVWSTYGDPGFVWADGMIQWPDGAVWFGDGDVSEVFQISANGGTTKRVIREGDGPGEIRVVRGFARHPAGGVMVHDRRGFSFFGADKRFVRHMKFAVPVGGAGLAVAPNGDMIMSSAFEHEGHELAKYAVHRFDGKRGWHVKSWHAAVDHERWHTVRLTSGGPVAVTRDGGLLVSERAPFRITRYADLSGNGAQLVIEDETVVSASELDRAVTYTPDGYRTTNAWTKSIFVHELDDGAILNVVWVYEGESRASSEWLVISPDGRILARESVEKPYRVWSATPDGRYLASYYDYETYQLAAAKLDVTVSPG